MVVLLRLIDSNGSYDFKPEDDDSGRICFPTTDLAGAWAQEGKSKGLRLPRPRLFRRRGRWYTRIEGDKAPASRPAGDFMMKVQSIVDNQPGLPRADSYRARTRGSVCS